MTEQTEYAIIRFLDQGNTCYKISDVVEGRSLMQFVKDQQMISKTDFYGWFSACAKQLENYYKNEAGEAYGFVNPYAIIITNEGILTLLDAGAKESEQLVKRMQKKSFRELFVRKEHVLEHKNDFIDDVYGFGQVLRFVLTKGTFKQEFSRSEQRCIRKWIDLCQKENVDPMSILNEIQKGSKLLTDRAERIGYSMRKSMIVITGLFFILLLVINVYRKQDIENSMQEASLPKIVEEWEMNEREKIYLELGIVYFSHEAYAEAREAWGQIKEESDMAEIYLALVNYVQNNGQYAVKEWNAFYNEGQAILGQCQLEKEVFYQVPFLEAYKKQNTIESWKKVKHIGEELKNKIAWGTDIEQEKIVRNYLGEAYFILEESEKALEEYQILQNMNINNDERKEVDLKIILLQEELDMKNVIIE